jgi:hypothetical protein
MFYLFGINNSLNLKYEPQVNEKQIFPKIRMRHLNCTILKMILEKQRTWQLKIETSLAKLKITSPVPVTMSRILAGSEKQNLNVNLGIYWSHRFERPDGIS